MSQVSAVVKVNNNDSKKNIECMFKNKKKKEVQKTWSVSQVKIKKGNELRKVIELRVEDWFNSEEEMKIILSKDDLFIKEFLTCLNSKIEYERRNKSDSINIIYKKLDLFQVEFFRALLKRGQSSNGLKNSCFCLGLSIISLLSTNRENISVFLEPCNETKQTGGASKEGHVDENLLLDLNSYLEEILATPNSSKIEMVSILSTISNCCYLRSFKEQLLNTSFFKSLKQCLALSNDSSVLESSTLLLVNYVRTLEDKNEMDVLFLKKMLEIEVFEDIKLLIFQKNLNIAFFSMQSLSSLCPLLYKLIEEDTFPLIFLDCIAKSIHRSIFETAKSSLKNYYQNSELSFSKFVVTKLLEEIKKNSVEYQAALKEEEALKRGGIRFENEYMLKSSIIRSRIVTLTEVAFELRKQEGFEESFVSKSGIITLFSLCKVRGGVFTEAVRFLEDHFQDSAVQYELKERYKKHFYEILV
jgi:hypothetical protein